MRSHLFVSQSRRIGDIRPMIKNPSQNQSAGGENDQRDGREPTRKQSKQPRGQQGECVKTHCQQEKKPPLSGKRYNLLPPTNPPKKMMHDVRVHSVNSQSDDPMDNISPPDIQRQSY
jgi:hypothetical protein